MKEAKRERENVTDNERRPTAKSGAMFLAFEAQDGSSPFCCDKPYDPTNGSCPVPSLGSYQPFLLPTGRIIYDRTNGAVMTNGTLPANLSQPGSCSNAQTTILQNQTAALPTTCPQEEATQVPGSGSERLTAVATGTAVPLGVLLLASVIAVAVLLRQNRSLRRSLLRELPVDHLPASQMSTSYERAEGRKGQGQAVYSYSSLNEMSDNRTPIESGGRTVAQELPGRFMSG